jgi:hypothetical protein
VTVIDAVLVKELDTLELAVELALEDAVVVTDVD